MCKIWNEAPHNAFTNLIRFKDQWYCCFREGQKHVSPDGALRVIRSEDGASWVSVACITSDNADLRDAQITETPDGRLMRSLGHCQQHVVFFDQYFVEFELGR